MATIRRPAGFIQRRRVLSLPNTANRASCEVLVLNPGFSCRVSVMFLPRKTIKMTEQYAGGGERGECCDATCWIRAAQKHPPPHHTRTERVRGMQNSACGEKKQATKPKIQLVTDEDVDVFNSCRFCTHSGVKLQYFPSSISGIE